jgi:hypothetical protein
MSSVPCVCTSDLCEHEAGQRCGEPVTVKVKCAVALGGSKFSDEFEAGICENCWGTITRHYPELFRNP